MHHLSGLDAAFLYMETPETPMHVGGLNIFELPLDYEGEFLDRLREHIAQRMHLAPVFQRVRWRLLQPAGELLVGRANLAAGAIHFVERNCHKPLTVFRVMRSDCMTSWDGSKARASAICIGLRHLLWDDSRVA